MTTGETMKPTVVKEVATPNTALVQRDPNTALVKRNPNQAVVRIAEGSGTHKLFATAVCASCHSRKNVKPHPEMTNVLICNSCLERSVEAVEYNELGVGD